MSSVRSRVRLAVVASTAIVVGVMGAAGSAEAAGPNTVATVITGTVTSTASSPLCVTGSTANFAGAVLTGTFTAGTNVFAGQVNVNGTVTATANSCSAAGVITNGTLNGPVGISGGLGVGSLSGQLNGGGTYTQVGNVAIANISVNYNGATNVPLTAVVTATPIPPSFSQSVVAGGVVGGSLS